MNTDFRVAVDFFAHHKARKLKRRLGSDGVMALLQLWAYAAKLRTDGDLSGMNTEDIELAADWGGEDGALVSVLVEVGFIDQGDSGYVLHDWLENNAWAAGAESRSDASRLSRMARTFPKEYATLVEAGVKGISKEDYEELRSVNDRSTFVQRMLNALPSPAPAPSPAPVPAPKAIIPVSSLENEDSARVEACAADINPAGTVPTEPSIDFQELRQFWDEHFRPEAPLAGFTEYKQLRAAKAYPGDSRIYEDLKARIDCQFWDQGFAPGLAKYLRERAWLRPPSATSRASPVANAKHESQADRAARLTYEAGMSVLAEMEQRGLNGGRALNAR